MKDKKFIVGEVSKANNDRMQAQKPNRKGHYKQGYFKVDKSKKFVGKGTPIYRSSLEYKFMNWCEYTPSVVSWASEPFAIGYIKPTKEGGSKQGNYYIDFVVDVQGKNGVEKWLVEVKPHAQTVKGSRDFDVNSAKWNSTIAFCKAKGYRFVIVTEKFKGFV